MSRRPADPSNEIRRLARQLLRLAITPRLLWVEWKQYTLAHAWPDGEEESLCGMAGWGMKKQNELRDVAGEPDGFEQPMPLVCPECLFQSGLGPAVVPGDRTQAYSCRIGEHKGCDGTRIELSANEMGEVDCECACHEKAEREE